MFHKATDLMGYVVHATDGVVGQVTDLFVDSEDWHVRYLVISPDNSTGDSSTGDSSSEKQSTLVSIAWVKQMDVDGQKLHLNASRQAIQEGTHQHEDEVLAAHREENDDSLNDVDEALRETFPASDPPTTY